MAKILLLNGPNLNLLGSREPHVYGHLTLTNLEQKLSKLAQGAHHELLCQQSNLEGELINTIQQAPAKQIQYALINAGAYTHTSIALRDALLATPLSFIEIHISNLAQRESFRQRSYLSDIAAGVIYGFGTYGYELALQAVCHLISTRN